MPLRAPLTRRVTMIHSLRRRYLPWLIRHLSLYPPYLGAGIRVHSDLDHNRYRVFLKLHWYNGNIFGSHFGGSLFAMCDPFFALILQDKLGRDYEVWLKWAEIDFVRPGWGTVSAEFHVPDERIEELRRQADEDGKVEPRFEVEVKDERDRVVARLTQRVHVRKRSRPVKIAGVDGQGALDEVSRG